MLIPEQLFVLRLNELRHLASTPTPHAVTKASAILRQLLIDGTSLSEIVNRKYRKKLLFPLLSQPQIEEVAATSTTVQLLLILPLSNDEGGDMPPLRTESLTTFLKTPCARVADEEITVLELIRFVANEEGGIHSTPRERPRNNKKCARLYSELGDARHRAIIPVFMQIVRSALMGLGELVDKIVEYPVELPIITPISLSYRTSLDARALLPGKAVFEPGKSLDVADPSHDFSTGIEFHIVMRLPVGFNGTPGGTIFEGRDHKGRLVQIVHEDSRRKAFISNGNDEILGVTIPDSPHHYREFHFLSIRFHLSEEGTTCDAVIDGRYIPGESTSESLGSLTFEYQRIGSRLAPMQSAASEIQEFWITGKMTEPQLSHLYRYLMAKLGYH